MLALPMWFIFSFISDFLPDFLGSKFFLRLTFLGWISFGTYQNGNFCFITKILFQLVGSNYVACSGRVLLVLALEGLNLFFGQCSQKSFDGVPSFVFFFVISYGGTAAWVFIFLPFWGNFLFLLSFQIGFIKPIFGFLLRKICFWGSFVFGLIFVMFGHKVDCSL